MDKFFVYILWSERLNKFYVGSSSDIERRLAEHNIGKSNFTKKGIPWLLKYKESFDSKKLAQQRERYIKKMKSRKFIESLILPGFPSQSPARMNGSSVRTG